MANISSEGIGRFYQDPISNAEECEDYNVIGTTRADHDQQKLPQKRRRRRQSIQQVAMRTSFELIPENLK